MYALIPHLDRDVARDDAAPEPGGSAPGRRPARPRRRGPETAGPALTRALAALTAVVLLAMTAGACGDSESPWGSTVSSDRRPDGEARRQATPPPTPDYRELAAVSPDGGDSAARSGTEPGREPSLPEDVTYPEAESLYHAGDYAAALRHFEAYTRDRPDNPWGHYMFALSARQAGQPERAVTGLEAALERDPDHVKSRVNLSRVLLELDRPEEARTHIEEALELAPESADVLRVAGNVAHELGDPAQARTRYRQALARDGTDAWSANNLGLLLLRQGRYREALLPLARAVELRPEVSVFRNNLGAALERTGHVRLAREQYREAAGAEHPTAGASLARVRDVTGSGGDIVELEALAHRFAERVRGWSAGGLAQRPAPPGDTASGPASDRAGDGAPGGASEAGDGDGTRR